MGVVYSISTIEKKIEDQVITCMFFAYFQNNTSGIYRMLNLRTKYIVLSCDIMWIKKPMEGKYQENKIPRQTFISCKMKTSPIIRLT